MSSVPVALLLVCPQVPTEEQTRDHLRLAQAAGLSEVIQIEPVAATSTDGLPPASHCTVDSHLTRFHLRGVSELGASLKIGLAYVLRREVKIVVIWTGHGIPSTDLLRTFTEPFHDDSLAGVWGGKPPGLCGNAIRAYRTDFLRRIPFAFNTNEDHFDAEIRLQAQGTHSRFQDIPMVEPAPCVFASRHPVGYALRRLGAWLRYHANRFSLIYHPKFDLLRDHDRYIFKQAPTSLHQHALKYPVHSGQVVVELGVGQGHISRAFHERGARVFAVDMLPPETPFPFDFLQCNLEDGFADVILKRHGRADVVVMLDVVEHVAQPERTMREVWRILKPGGVLLASTANVAFIPLRFMLLIGLFNYGRRGILDLTHRRLFTYRSFRRLLIDSGFHPESWRGFGPPVADLIGRSPVWLALDRIGAVLARLAPQLFAYQFFARAIRREGLEDILDQPQPSHADQTSSQPQTQS